MKRLQIAQYIALVATLLSVLGYVLYYIFMVEGGSFLLMAGFCLGLVSYLFGGLLTAIKMSLKIAKWGWMVFIFPWDIVAFVFGAMFAAIAFVCLPIIPIRKAYKESMFVSAA